MELVQQMLQRGRSLELGETYAMTLAELGQYREAQALQRDLIAAARAGWPDRREGPADRAPAAVRSRRSVPHAVDRRGDAMRVLLALALRALVAQAAQPAQAPAVTPMAIVSADTDAGAGTLTIAGTGFGTRPFVTLDLVPLNVQLALDQRIIAVVPVGMIPPGSYLLTVTRGPQPGESASFDVRIGLPPGDPSRQPELRPPGLLVRSRLPLRRILHRFRLQATPRHASATRQSRLADVDREWQRTDPAGYLTASRHLYDARRRVLTDMVNNELLSREAASRGLTVDALLKEELPKRTVPLPDTSLTALYQSLGDRSRGATLDQLRPALREWLARKVEPELAKMTYIEELTKVSTRADTLLAAATRAGRPLRPTIRRWARRRHRSKS